MFQWYLFLMQCKNGFILNSLNFYRLADSSRLKLLENYIKSRTVQKKLQRESEVIGKALEDGPESLARLLHMRKTEEKKEKDIFELPELKKDDDDYDSSDSEREDVMSMLNIHHSTDIHQVLC